MEITENTLYICDWRSLIRLANALGIPYTFVMETDMRRISLVVAVKKRIDEERLYYLMSKFRIK